MTTKPKGEQEAEVTLTTQHIERIVSNFVAERGGVPTPFVYTFNWVWSLGTDGTSGGPLCHVRVVRAPEQVRPMPSRLTSKKGKTP